MEVNNEGRRVESLASRHDNESVQYMPPAYLNLESVEVDEDRNVAKGTSSASIGSARTGTSLTIGSMFDFSNKMSSFGLSGKVEIKKEESTLLNNDNLDDGTTADRSFNFRSWLSADLQREAKELEMEAISLKRERRASERASAAAKAGDVTSRLEKVKQKREARSKEREVKQKEMTSLMEQVASIAAQSRGIMRARPKQSEEQKILGEIITLMGKMAEKMSTLMLITEPKVEEEETHEKNYNDEVMSAEAAEEKIDQIFALLAVGGDAYELEWKRMELRSILTSETYHPRRRTSEKNRALEGLALTESNDNRSLSAASKSSRYSDMKREFNCRSSHRSKLSRANSIRSSGSRSRSQRESSPRRSSSLGNRKPD
jgi:hypothetical protein